MKYKRTSKLLGARTRLGTCKYAARALFGQREWLRDRGIQIQKSSPETGGRCCLELCTQTTLENTKSQNRLARRSRDSPESTSDWTKKLVVPSNSVSQRSSRNYVSQNTLRCRLPPSALDRGEGRVGGAGQPKPSGLNGLAYSRRVKRAQPFARR